MGNFFVILEGCPLGESLVSEVLTEVCSSDVIPGGKVSIKPVGSAMRESLG